MSDNVTTLEWFGVTTYRLRTAGLTIFLDAWLDKPSTLKSFISLENAIKDGFDYIFISHTHFDHLLGATALAKATGAAIIANCEAISLCQAGGVSDSQLMRVLLEEKVELAPNLPNAPVRPHPRLAALTVQIWPGLHCLLPNAPAVVMPDEPDAAALPAPASDPVASKLAGTDDITLLVKYGFLRMAEIVPAAKDVDHYTQSLLSWLEAHQDTSNSCMSACDGGNLLYNLLIPTSDDVKALLWNAQLGYYSGIIGTLLPKPDFVILSVAGQGNLNGRPVSCSAAEFIVNEVKELVEPERFIWCLCDESPIRPYKLSGKAVTVKHAEVFHIW